jgi:pyruvate formate lyase activating enzyme
MKKIIVSNGYLSSDAAHQIAPYLDAINIDLKAFSDTSYKEVCGTRLKPVLETIRLMKALGVWVEVTTLIIPCLNDREEELRQIAHFVKGIAPEVPWLVTRFYAAYKYLDRPPIPVAPSAESVNSAWRRDCNMCTRATCRKKGVKIPIAMPVEPYS